MGGTIKLYELVIENGCPISPYVWRTAFALAHKGLSRESIPVGFCDIPAIAGGGYKTVPIIEDGATVICDSWAIADYLDQTYPDRPLFASASERSLAEFFDNWFLLDVMRRMFGLYVLDIHDQARPEDQDYFRRSREGFLNGAPLETIVSDRESRVPALREALAPLRMALSSRPWIGGAQPGYADYIALGGFLWAASVATLPPLANDDPLLDWLNRGFDLYGGLGRDPRLRRLWEE